MRNLMIVILAVAFVFTSCKKYPDGPSFSLRSKTERLSNSWKINHFYENGVDKTADANNLWSGYTLSIDKEGSYTIAYKILGLLPYSESGTWAFNSDKSKVIFTKTSPAPTTNSEWTILRLKEDELWGQYSDSTKVFEVQLLP